MYTGDTLHKLRGLRKISSGNVHELEFLKISIYLLKLPANVKERKPLEFSGFFCRAPTGDKPALRARQSFEFVNNFPTVASSNILPMLGIQSEANLKSLARFVIHNDRLGGKTYLVD